MAENIVAGLFGLNPQQVRQQDFASLQNQAQNFGMLSPEQRAAAGMYQAGGMLAQPLARMAGMVNPVEQQAQQTQQIMGLGGDLQTPEGIRAKAGQFAQAGDQRTAFQLIQLANAREAEISKQMREAAQTNLAMVQANELPQMRHEEALARLTQQAQIAEQTARNTQLSIEQRREAAREANATKLEIARMIAESKAAAGPKLTKGQEAADREFGKEYSQYQAGGGSADVEKQLKQLEQVSDELGKPGNDYTGPTVGLIPAKVRSMTNPDAVAAQNRVEEVAQRNLRLVLGAQFTQVEGERLIARAYNPQMNPLENKARVDALIKQIRTAAQVKEDAAKYFEEHGTLSGWKGRMPTLGDFDKAISEAKSGKESQPSVPVGVDPKIWSVMTPQERKLWTK